MDYVNKMKSQNILQLIAAPTRITPRSKTLIDHIYISGYKKVSLDSGIFLNKISDHLATFLNINIKPKSKPGEKEKTRIMSRKNIEKFKLYIQDFKIEYSLRTFINSNDRWDYFLDTLTKLFEKAFPLKDKSHKKSKSKIWITGGIIKSIKIKEKLYKKFKDNPTPYNERTFKAYKNNLNKLIKKPKKNTIQNSLVLIQITKSYGKKLIQ